MAPPRWWDGYNSLFALLGQLVQRDLPQLLEKKLKNIGNTISQHEKGIEDLRVEASAAGVADLEAALASLQPIGPASTVGISTKVRYVEALMRWNAHQEMRKQKMGLSMVLQGPMAVHVHAKASDNKKEEQLRKAVVACEMELQIDPGKLAGPYQRWAPGQEEYDAGARQVALRVCIAEAREIQDRVFRIKMIKQDKAQESGNAATKMGRKISKLRSEAEQHLQLYLEWQAKLDGRGQYRWVEGVGASSSSATRHFGQRYRQLCAQRDRSAEEVGILHCEVLRLCNGLEERTALIEANLAELQPAGGDDVIGADRCNATHAWPA
ncbi:expressed protein [Chlorella variabilis]|uniref:Expressed protein n=1 Tax=Chlorella variabilis TaxID=554065 RepID=E1ZUH7_CHLVA|nr:expressed protein [Chlorella variabilis]EFN50518.1 expressed protein [Chlorella variabilis]|eukprot:XP_005842650.1 expressed protein [Chlorella variabilis]